MNQDNKTSVTMLKVDGGMTSNELLMQLQADLIGIDVGQLKSSKLNIQSTFV